MEAINGKNSCKDSSKRRGDDGNSYDEGTEQTLSSSQSNDAEVPNSPRLANSPDEETVSEPDLEATVPSSSSRRSRQGCSSGRSGAIHYHTYHLHYHHHHHHHHRHHHYLRHPTSYPAGQGNGSSSDTSSSMQLGTAGSSNSSSSQMDWAPPDNRDDQQVTPQSWRQKPLKRNLNAGNGERPVFCTRCQRKPVAIKVHPCNHVCLCRRCAVALWRLRRQCPFPNCTKRIRKIYTS